MRPSTFSYRAIGNFGSAGPSSAAVGLGCIVLQVKHRALACHRMLVNLYIYVLARPLMMLRELVHPFPKGIARCAEEANVW